ncbi:chorismate mutase aro7 [Dispira parvispora]|uniref:Chorismate mutase n=1 Tax=Dispira parvispora TaxID=1520584 RepID=A0A9W8AME6_9FUNG|nr:chorismate mutase aro7 [Dispira parvispora]
MDLLSHSAKLTLPELRNTLIRLEDTIIFGLIERCQFKHNDIIYQPGAFQFATGYKGSFLQNFLWELEKVHAKVRRYQSPDEYPFFQDLPEPILPPLDYPEILHPNEININDKIYNMYTHDIVPQACAPGDDKNYGSSATRDIECLHALSKRIHYGKFIAEAKFQDPKYHDKYVQLIRSKDNQGIYDLLTNLEVEKKLLRRLHRKAMVYGQDLDEEVPSPYPNDDPPSLHSSFSSLSQPSKINADLVVQLYEQYVIPLTKEVEVEYLLQRLD